MMRLRPISLLLVLSLFLVGEVEAKSLASKAFRYGNFCGSGHGNSSTKKPIDQLDEGCKAHDLCCKKAVKAGLGVKICPCHCDKKVRQAALRFLRTKKGRTNAKARRAAMAIAAVFSVHACYCRGRVCLPKIKCRIKKRCRKRKRRKKGRCVRLPQCSLQKKCRMAKTPGKGGKCLPVRCKKKKLCKRFMGKKFCFTGVRCK